LFLSAFALKFPASAVLVQQVITYLQCLLKVYVFFPFHNPLNNISVPSTTETMPMIWVDFAGWIIIRMKRTDDFSISWYPPSDAGLYNRRKG
jgi:hypothetical protein